MHQEFLSFFSFFFFKKRERETTRDLIQDIPPVGELREPRTPSIDAAFKEALHLGIDDFAYSMRICLFLNL